MHRVEQPVPREFRVEVESDESAFQPVVDGKRKGGPDVRIHGGLVVAIEQVQQSARVVGEPAAVRKVANVADARPAGRHDVLGGGAQPARIGQAHDIPDFDRQPAFRDRRRNRIAGDRIADLRVNRSAGRERKEQKRYERQRCTHEPSSGQVASSCASGMAGIRILLTLVLGERQE